MENKEEEIKIERQVSKEIPYSKKKCIDMAFQEGIQKAIEPLNIWLEQFEKIVNWHKERSLLPYDWNDYEHKKIIELREILQKVKHEVKK